jgi:hypothetical protein
MKASLISAPIGLFLALTGCVHATQSVEMPVQAVTATGGNCLVRVEVPTDWRPMAPSASRAEYLAPDNRSRAYLRVMPAEADPARCPELARQYMRDYIDAWGGPPRTRVANRVTSGDHVDFELHRTDPRPHGEVIWGRVVCRNGALAIVACTVPRPRAEELRSSCRTMLESLQVTPQSQPGPNASSTKS